VLPKQAARSFKCACGHEFVPLAEGVPCPSCGAVVIMPEGKITGDISCLECSYIFRKYPWWRKRRNKVLLIIAAIILFISGFVLYRWYSNTTLAEELQTEFDEWLAGLPKVPDAENGMLVLVKGTDILGKITVPAFFWEDIIDMKDSASATATGQFLAANKQALDTVRKGLKYKKFLFPADYSKGPATEIPNLLGFKIAARAFVFQGWLHESQGMQVLALEEYLNALRLGRTLANERSIISAMIEVAVLGIGFKPLMENIALNWLKPEELEYVLKELISLHRRSGDFSKALETEYYTGFTWIIREMAGGEIDLSELGIGRNILFRIIFSRFLHNYRADMETFRKWLDICRKTDPANYWSMPPEAKDSDAFLKYFDIRPGELSLVSIFLPNLIESTKFVTETEVLWRGAIALTAVRLFQSKNGRLPKDFSEIAGLVPKELLIDPFSGKELRYRVEGSDFYLYSVGYNGTDDSGTHCAPVYKPGSEHPANTSDYVIHAPWPQKK